MIGVKRSTQTRAATSAGEGTVTQRPTMRGRARAAGELPYQANRVAGYPCSSLTGTPLLFVGAGVRLLREAVCHVGCTTLSTSRSTAQRQQVHTWRCVFPACATMSQ